MRTILTTIASLILSVQLFAQSYTIYNGDGSISRADQNRDGGYTIYNGDGSITTVSPERGGGYTIYYGNGSVGSMEPDGGYYFRYRYQDADDCGDLDIDED